MREPIQNLVVSKPVKGKSIITNAVANDRSVEQIQRRTPPVLAIARTMESAPRSNVRLTRPGSRNNAVGTRISVVVMNHVHVVDPPPVMVDVVIRRLVAEMLLVMMYVNVRAFVMFGRSPNRLRSMLGIRRGTGQTNDNCK